MCIRDRIPDRFLRDVVDFELPAPGSYAVGIAFLPVSEAARAETVRSIESIAREEQLVVLGWRALPTTPDLVGQAAREVMPHFEQLFVTAKDGCCGLELDRLTYCLRKRAEHETSAYFPSLSSRTLVYKGMLTTGQLEPFFPDLSDARFETELALVHSRFSTNTFPSWPLAHPYRLIAHNGEINTVRGNRNWMASVSYTHLADRPVRAAGRDRLRGAAGALHRGDRLGLGPGPADRLRLLRRRRLVGLGSGAGLSAGDPARPRLPGPRRVARLAACLLYTSRCV